jgi:predicted enzyme related to lactoylglutathione lyase
MQTFKNAISWFEIPTTDLDRAQAFYEDVFQTSLEALVFPQIQMRVFPVENPMEGIGGALVKSDSHRPSASDGPLIYLNGNPDVAPFLERVEKSGGKVLMPKTQISPEYGHMGLFLDSEGNRMALHSI